MKKKIVTLGLVAVLALTAIGSTMAYFTDKASVTNVMTSGDLDIVLDEAEVTKDQGTDTWTAGEERVAGNDYGQVYPGAVLPKDPIIHNVGDHDAYVWATVNVSNWMNIAADMDIKYATEDGLKKLIGETMGEGWSIYECGIPGDVFQMGQFDAKYVLKYDKRLAAGESTSAMFETITVPAEFDSFHEYLFDNIKVEGFAIQAEGFADWQDAYDAYNA